MHHVERMNIRLIFKVVDFRRIGISKVEGILGSQNAVCEFTIHLMIKLSKL